MKPSKHLRHSSVILSFVFAGLFLVFLVVVAFLLPSLVENMISAGDLIGDRTNLPPALHTLILVLAYLVLAVAFVAVGILCLILRCVLLEQVFSSRTVTLLSGVAWCCFAEGILFFVVGIWFQLAFIVFAAAFFLGLCLRIVGNVIAEATRYKNENDLTV